MINQKKKLAFILGGMSSGGPSRSFLNVSSLIDYNKYDVDLILFSKGGVLINEVPSEINIKLVNPRGLFCSFSENKVQFLLWLPVRLLFGVLKKYFLNLFSGDKAKLWSLKRKFIHKDKCFYDLAISYAEGFSAYYLVDKINAQVKIARIPVNYDTISYRKDFDYKYFKQLDYLFSNSIGAKEKLCNHFPSLKPKIHSFFNISSKELIGKLASRDVGFSDDFTGFRIITLANAHKKKGVLLAMQACKRLIDDGFTIKWYWMGGRDKSGFLKILEQLELTEIFVFMPPRPNPFPFLKQADVYVHPSYSEGNSNAVIEAKALCKPIIIGNFHNAPEIIQHKINGLISELNPESLTETIKRLLNSPDLRDSFSEYWKNNFDGNESEMNKLLDLL
jgi:glycosyltransferase involved in cell wall biosynthesis